MPRRGDWYPPKSITTGQGCEVKEERISDHIIPTMELLTVYEKG